MRRKYITEAERRAEAERIMRGIVKRHVYEAFGISEKTTDTKKKKKMSKEDITSANANAVAEINALSGNELRQYEDQLSSITVVLNKEGINMSGIARQCDYYDDWDDDSLRSHISKVSRGEIEPSPTLVNQLHDAIKNSGRTK